MKLRANKTKIVCTIGPATDSVEKMEALLRAGMDIARLNFSHGDFGAHKETIQKLRHAASNTGHRLAIMADLPGPKMRIGELAEKPVELQIGDRLILTTEEILGNRQKVSVSLKELPKIVKVEDKLFLNDGLISLKVVEVKSQEVVCEVRAGGELLSRKGLNLPGIDLGFGAFTEHRRPTRAEATDVANAILDGTDAVMLSAESAMGRYPVEAVEMLAEISAQTEPSRQLAVKEQRIRKETKLATVDLIAHCVQQAVTKWRLPISPAS